MKFGYFVDVMVDFAVKIETTQKEVKKMMLKK